jgi:hypothetical protein
MTTQYLFKLMQLFTTHTDENFPLFKLVSTNNRWEIGIRQMMFGVRVCGNLIGDTGYTFDYCAGNNPYFAANLIQTMLAIFDALPEDIKPRELRQMLPSFSVKPIDRDPTCWKELQKLAIELNQQAPIHSYP